MSSQLEQYNLVNDVIQPGIHVIEASAGTGKTFHLSFLFVRLHLQHNIPLNKLCAITFTNLASAELKHRINQLFAQIRQYAQSRGNECVLAPVVEAWIENTYSSHQLADLVKRCHLALLNLPHANISTIHSFFQDIIRRYYLYADIEANFTVLETAQWHTLSQMWANQFWLLQQQEIIAKKQVFNQLFPQPTSLFHTVPADSVGRVIAIELPELNWQEIQAVFDRFKSGKKYEAQSNLARYYFKNAFLQFITKKTKLCVQQGYLNFNLILQKADESSLHEQFCQHIRDQITAILIDEFQDTDYIQWQIIKRLFFIPLKSSIKSLSHIIYLIGDPKQSIYRFRSADINCYFEALSNANYREELFINWRSDDQLLTTLNTLYQQSSINPTPFEHPNLHYTEVLPPEHRKNKNSLYLNQDIGNNMLENHGIILRSTDSYERILKPSAEKVIYQWIVKDCLQLCQLVEQQKAYLYDHNENPTPLAYSDILILCSHNERINQLSDLLKSYHIPVSQEQKKTIWQSEASNRVIWLLQTLVEQYDEKLLSKKTQGILCLILGFPPEQQNATLYEKLSEVFAQWQKLLQTAGPLSLWQKILEHQFYGSFAVNQQHLKLHLAEITRLFQQLQYCWKEGQKHITDWLDHIHHQIDIEEKHSHSINAIRIMTVHAAKGLEASIVICPDLWIGGNARLNFSDYLHYSESHQHYVLTQEPELEAKKIEGHRLLYVALTRAKSKLLLYWVPYRYWGRSKDKHKGVSIESLLFQHDIDEKSNIERLQTLPNLHVLSETEPLFSDFEIIYSGREKLFQSPPILTEEIHSSDLKSNPYSGLWSFSRLYRQNVSQQMYSDEYEKDQMMTSEAFFTEKPSRHFQHSNWLLPANELGILVHKIIENILHNPKKIENITDSVQSESQELLQTLPLNEQQYEATYQQITSWVLSTLCCKLSMGNEHYSLSSDVWQFHTEMRFDLRVQHWPIKQLNHLILRYPHLPLKPLDDIIIRDTLFYGFIDLVLVPKDRLSNQLWIVDFKTNFLGDQYKDYDRVQMHHCMQEHFYGWQGLFYALAIYRWLKITGSCLGKNDGINIAYLFCRGLVLAENHPNFGKYEFYIPQQFLLDMDAVLS